MTPTERLDADRRSALAPLRLQRAREALLLDGYFTPEQVGDDIAPRIIERLAAVAPVEALRVDLEAWKARALAAEAASEHKEHLLELLCKAAEQQGRIVAAVGVSLRDVKSSAIYVQSNHGDDDATLARLVDMAGPYVELLQHAVEAAEGRDAQAILDATRKPHPSDVGYERNYEQAVFGACEALGYGRIMGAVSARWAETDPLGALDPGPCLGTLQRRGFRYSADLVNAYDALLEEVELARALLVDLRAYIERVVTGTTSTEHERLVARIDGLLEDGPPAKVGRN